jgi:hypothetical protein
MVRPAVAVLRKTVLLLEITNLLINGKEGD